MKKVLGLSLSALMVLTLTACGGNSGPELANSYDYFYSTDMSTLDYVTTNKANNHQHTVNFVEGLLQNDATGAYIPAAAESYETNEDATVWTFHLREGIQWVTATGEEYGAELTAHDYVTGLRHAADFDSEMLELVDTMIVNLKAYADGTASWEDVGVKALDDYTLEYTLNDSVPYFNTMTTYTILYPINQEFLESKGAGCKLGAPDKNTCEFGLLQPDSILYSGPFILSNLTAKSEISYTKNNSYWDADNVFVDTVSLIYYDGQDKYGIINAYENGQSVAAPIRGDWADYSAYAETYKDYMIAPRPNAYSFGINFNLNRISYNNTNKTTEAERENTRNALQNSDFRNAIFAAFDRVSYLSVTMQEEVAISNLRNMNGVPALVHTSDGTSYDKLVAAAYQEMTGNEIDLSDGQDPFYNPDAVDGYIEKAKAAGITFPVTLDLLCEDLDTAQAVASSLKTSVETNTDGQILINIIPLPEDDYLAQAFYNNNPDATDYDISTASGWGPDYADPKTFCDVYSIANNGAFLTNIGLYPEGENVQSDAAAQAVGLDEYQQLLDEADAIKSDLDARYEAYAKADAWILANAVYIPVQQQGTNLTVTKVVPFTQPYALGGAGGYKMNFMKVQVEPVTVEEYEAAKAEFEG